MGINKLMGLTLGAAALSLSVLVAGTAADQQVKKKIDKVDLSELRDGETRSFGKGNSAVTATRKGDEITITYAGEEGTKKTIKCEVGKESCYAMTLDGAGDSHVVVLDAEASDGKDSNQVFVTSGSGDGKSVIVVAGEGEEGGKLAMHGLPGMTWVGEDGCCAASDGSGCSKDKAANCTLSAVKVIKVSHEDSVLLECPQGDATLTLKKGEENSGPYFCPKHNVKMEVSKSPAIMKRIVVDTNSKDDPGEEE
jgi:hypothetical protein